MASYSAMTDGSRGIVSMGGLLNQPEMQAGQMALRQRTVDAMARQPPWRWPGAALLRERASCS
jgi:hypothetical protein